MTLSYVMQIIALRLMWQHKSQSTWASNSGVDISSQINLSIIEKLFMLIIRNLKSCRLSQVRTWIQFCVWCKFLLNPSQVMFYEQQGLGSYFFLCSVVKFFLCDQLTTIINALVSMTVRAIKWSFNFWHCIKPGHWGYRPLEIIRNSVPVRTISE